MLMKIAMFDRKEGRKEEQQVKIEMIFQILK